MTTQSKAPSPDWASATLTPEQQTDLQRLFDAETHLKIAQGTGMAFLGYIRAEQPSEEEVSILCLAWWELICNRD